VRLTLLEQRLARVAGSTGTANATASRSGSRGDYNNGLRAARVAPTLTVSGQKLSWNRVDNINTYVLLIRVPKEAVQYSVVSGISVTPPPVPGDTVSYSVRTTTEGSTWSTEKSITYAAAKVTEKPKAPEEVKIPVKAPEEKKAPEEVKAPEKVNTQAAPELIVSGQKLVWNAIAGVTTYVLVTKVPGKTEQFSEVSGTSITPAAVPGVTVHYRVRTAVEGSTLSLEVAITYPAATPPPVTSPPPVTTPEPAGVIIGTNDALGWGFEVGAKTFAAGITSDRVEIAGDLNSPKVAKEHGFTNNVVVVGNTNDTSSLASINIASWTASTLAEVKSSAAEGDTLMEVENEVFLKGGNPQGTPNDGEPVKYAEMFVSLANAVNAAGLTNVKLLFNSFGNYSGPKGSSIVPGGHGWLADAVAAVPSLKTLVGGFTHHPYGLAGENNEYNWGPGALKAEHEQAVSLGFQHTNYYVTEFGVEDEASGKTGSASPAQQAERVKAVYTELIGFGYVKGIWYYESHDDGTGNTGKWGFVSGSWTPRPVLAVLEGFAKEEGQ